MIELPLGVRRILESGEGVLFIGAGIGEHLKDGEGKQAPDSETLAIELDAHFSLDTGGITELAKISQLVELRKGRTELENFLRKKLINLEPDDYLKQLFSFKWKSIYTTNYDRGIQRSYELIAMPTQNPVTIASTSELVSYDLRFDVPIFHLHGTLFGSGKPNIIITEDDYSRFREHRKMLFEKLKLDFATSPIVYIGYSNRDPNWKMVLSEMAIEFFPSKMPLSYRIVPETNAIDREILRSKNIEVIDCALKEFIISASTVVLDIQKESDMFRQIRMNIPPDLMEPFDKYPVAVSRLLSSWTYVNQAPFDVPTNISPFLLGDRPNWALIGAKQYFERDIEDDIYESLVDFATGSEKKPRVNIVLGSAGYGVTTLLMILAVRLVRDRAGHIFILKPSRPILEGDIEFATSLFEDRVFFFVDNAADHSDTIHTVVHKAKETRRPMMFLLGERLNEWRQGHGKLTVDEFLVEPLSDSEINRLIDFLGMHHALNKIKNLSRELQFSAIKVAYNKELLVAMREATEGNSFDAIIEDEYWGIGDSISRQLYLIVCCFYQHGAYARDQLLSQIIETPLPELYSATSDSTEGVIVYDCLDEGSGIYGARARHRTIAKIVWERCGKQVEKDHLIQISIKTINTKYMADKNAFDLFTRSDRLVDGIHSLEGKIKFFDTACRKDPQNAYIRQHYARMLLREDKAELALGQITEAIKIDPRVRILYHTKGLILMYLAEIIESHDIARRRLAQSEESFRQALSMHPRDEYSYQGLAQLFCIWAKRAPTLEEKNDYIAKAEDVISEGLKKVKVREALWIESGKIQQLLGDNPAQIKALENAIKERPGSIVARYLLGRTYRKAGKYEEAIRVIEPTIMNHHDECRSFVEYAICLLYLGRPLSEAIAVLRLSTLYGYSDPRFIAILGGILFVNKEFTESQKVFLESTKRNFAATELNSIQFRPPNIDDPTVPIRIMGKVVLVKAGYVLIETKEYPRIICPGSKFGGNLMTHGLEVTFELCFTAKGPVADKPIPC